MATVWRARDQTLGRTVAIKVMSDALAANPTAVARFVREAQTHAGISHPNLVQIFDYSTAVRQPYLVLEYVAGRTLSARLKQAPLNADELRRLADDLLSAISCIHNHGVLHRDIKPSNVLIDTDGRARLTDFGVAQLEGGTRLTQPGDVVGTLRYLAPEVLRGAPQSRQSDLFALGVLLQAAAGGSEIDTELRKLIDRLTSPNPDMRPRGAHAALSRLRHEPATVVLRQEPTTAVLRRTKARFTRGAAAKLGRRLAAVTAILAAGAAALTLIIVNQTGAPPRAPASHVTSRHAAVHRATQHQIGTSPSASASARIDAQLNQLARSVRRVAGERR